MSDEYLSDDGPGSDLFDPYESGWWKSTPTQIVTDQDLVCPKCKGEGYIVFGVYPWDGCSYDEKPCDLCKTTGRLTEATTRQDTLSYDIEPQE